MSKEFHVFTHQESAFELALVFEVNREEDDMIVFNDMYMVATTKHGELKTRVQFNDVISSVINTRGGNIDNYSVSTIIDVFKDLIPESKQVELQVEIDDKEIKNISADELIKLYERDNDETDRGTSQET